MSHFTCLFLVFQVLASNVFKYLSRCNEILYFISVTWSVKKAILVGEAVIPAILNNDLKAM